MHSSALLLLAVLSGLIALVGGWPITFRVTYVLGGLFGLCFVWARIAALSLTLERTTNVWRSQVGREVEHQMLLRSWLPLWLPWVEVREASPLAATEIEQVVSLGPRAARYWTARATCTRRGRYSVGPTRLVVSDPFGLFRVERLVPATTTLLVLPSTAAISYAPRGAEQASGGRPTSEGASMPSVSMKTLRAYQPGDPLRHLHWPSTARFGRLMVREFEPEPSSDVWLMLDLERTGYRRAGLEDADEYGITVAASLLAHFSQSGRAVGLTSQSFRIAPARGEAHLLNMLEWLAVAQTQSGTSLAGLLRREDALLGLGASLVIVTPALKQTWETAAEGLAERGLKCDVFQLVGRGARLSLPHGASPLQGQRISIRQICNGETVSRALAGKGS